MGRAEPMSSASPEQEREPAALLPAPPARVATIVALQRSAGNAAVARLVGGLPPALSAPRPPQPSAGDETVAAKLADTARARSAPAGPEAADPLTELRARVPEIARELVLGSIGVRAQHAGYRQLAEQRLEAEEQSVTEVLQPAANAEAAAQALARYARVRIGVLASTTESLAIVLLPWEQLNDVGALETPGFDAGQLIREVRGAIKGWGTDEARLFKAIEGHTPLQLAAMRKAYRVDLRRRHGRGDRRRPGRLREGPRRRRC